MENLKYISEPILDELAEAVPSNIDRYLSGDFADLAQNFGWAVELKTVKYDKERLAELQCGSTSPEAEIHNSLIVHDALIGMRRAVAREERIWVRLCHLDGLDYARSRWLDSVTAESAEPKIRSHFFANSLTQVRDDNALGRLWWNAEIAKIASPDDVQRGLSHILKTADIRLNFVERTRIASRPVLAKGVVDALEAHPWLTEGEKNFRRFMRILNRDGGGVLYEAIEGTAVTDLMSRSLERAQASMMAPSAQ